jgi:hypothetical protein
MPSRKPRNPPELPGPATPTLHTGGASFPGTVEGNRVADQVSRQEGRLHELETKRIPELEKEVHGLKMMLRTIAGLITLAVAVAGIIAKVWK